MLAWLANVLRLTGPFLPTQYTSLASSDTDLMAENCLFITGMQRSGTTLLDKLLSSQPKTRILSQPFPYLYLHAKRRFLAELGDAGGRYPLDPLFLERRYRPDDFSEFLDRLRIAPESLREILDEQQSYSGQQEQIPGKLLDHAVRTSPGHATFAELLIHCWESLVDRPDQVVVGSKEIQCEEFVTNFLRRGIRCLIILRDPRDVLASLNTGTGHRYGGAIKPTLFNIRNWRKSVAFALAFDQSADFLYLRYEDLATSPDVELERIRDWLPAGALPHPEAASRLTDAAGRPWRGNSSFEEKTGVSASSVGRWRNVLPADVARLVEAACLPELIALDYPVSMDLRTAERTLAAFTEPYPDTRRDLAWYADAEARSREEAERLDMLRANSQKDEFEQWFIFRRAGTRLAQAMESYR